MYTATRQVDVILAKAGIRVDVTSGFKMDPAYAGMTNGCVSPVQLAPNKTPRGRSMYNHLSKMT
jgi:hypothetical protein